MNDVNPAACDYLGQKIKEYSAEHNRSYLVPIERKLVRQENGVSDDFIGYDIWHCYECSFLTNKGIPITLVGKIKIPADSKFFIESNSMKLYFFSYNMVPMGETVDEAIENFVEQVKSDLSATTETDVEFSVHNKREANVVENYANIYSLVDIDQIECKDYSENINLLKPGNSNEIKVYFPALRSNCWGTHQPDFATVCLYIKGQTPTYESLIQYLTSFRGEKPLSCEEVTERIFNAIKTKFNVQSLSVHSLFTRRGGVDICPCRVTNLDLLEQDLISNDVLTFGSVNQ